MDMVQSENKELPGSRLAVTLPSFNASFDHLFSDFQLQNHNFIRRVACRLCSFSLCRGTYSDLQCLLLHLSK